MAQCVNSEGISNEIGAANVYWDRYRLRQPILTIRYHKSHLIRFPARLNVILLAQSYLYIHRTKSPSHPFRLTPKQ